jgi:hypothetical protein
MIFWKVQKYTRKWALFTLLYLWRYGDILGQNQKILLKNHRKLGKLYNYFIIINILNPKESFYNEMSQVIIKCLKNNLFIVLIILGKMSRFFVKLCEAIKYWVLWNSCMHKLYIRMQSVNKKMLILRLQWIWEIIQYNLFHVQLIIFIHILCIHYFLKLRYLLDN